MDISTLFAVGMLTPIDRLVPHATYTILHMERIEEDNGHHLLVKLWEEWYHGVGQFVYIILPDYYRSRFSPTLVVAINSFAVLYKLILVGFSPRGWPVLRFERYHRSVV